LTRDIPKISHEYQRITEIIYSWYSDVISKCLDKIENGEDYQNKDIKT